MRSATIVARHDHEPASTASPPRPEPTTCSHPWVANGADVADDLHVMRLVERFTEYLQQAYMVWQRSDGLVQDASAFKAYAHPAT